MLSIFLVDIETNIEFAGKWESVDGQYFKIFKQEMNFDNKQRISTGFPYFFVLGCWGANIFIGEGGGGLIDLEKEIVSKHI